MEAFLAQRQILLEMVVVDSVSSDVKSMMVIERE
jgi:hypothetical protein